MTVAQIASDRDPRAAPVPRIDHAHGLDHGQRDGVATSSRFREHRSDRVINDIVAGARQRFSCFLLLQERLRR